MSTWCKENDFNFETLEKAMEVDFMVSRREDSNSAMLESNNNNISDVPQKTANPEETGDERLSYANVAGKREEQNGVENKNHESSAERKQRMFTIYRLATAIPSEGVIARAIGQLFEKEPREVIAKIQRDTRYRSRYNILFKNKEDCNFIIRYGITIEGQRIGGRRDPYSRRNPMTHIYIPNFPASGTKQELFDILSKEISVGYVKERMHPTLGIAIGGWKAGVFVSLGHPIPDSINYEEENYDVIYPGKKRKEKPSPQVSDSEDFVGDWSKPIDKSNILNEEPVGNWSKPIEKSKALNNNELRQFIDKINMATVEKDLELSDTEIDESSIDEMEGIDEIPEANKTLESEKTEDETKVEVEEKATKESNPTHENEGGFIKVKTSGFKKKRKRRTPQKLVEKQKETIALLASTEFAVPEAGKSRGKESDRLAQPDLT